MAITNMGSYVLQQRISIVELFNENMSSGKINLIIFTSPYESTSNELLKDFKVSQWKIKEQKN